MVSTSKVKILIAIIAWNEEDSIQKVFDGIKRLNLGGDSEYRVVVFNDSSTDDTLRISKKNNVEVVSHPFQSGNGMFVISTYLSGSTISSGDDNEVSIDRIHLSPSI